MRTVLILMFTLSFLLMSGCALPEVQKAIPPAQQPESPPTPIGTLNSDQPIPIGETVFSAERSLVRLINSRTGKAWPDPSNLRQAYYYIYQGLDDKNNLIVLHKHEDKDTQTRESIPLALPLNDKKQTILRVKTLQLSEGVCVDGPKKDLLISVVDEFNRITAEELSRTQTK